MLACSLSLRGFVGNTFSVQIFLSIWKGMSDSADRGMGVVCCATILVAWAGLDRASEIKC